MARKLALDPFGKRQFNNPNYTGTQISFSEEEFEKKINEYYDSGMPLKDGYAPFWYVCIVFVTITINIKITFIHSFIHSFIHYICIFTHHIYIVSIYSFPISPT